MTQHLGDLGEGGPGLEHPRGSGVPQPMSTHRLEPCAPTGMPHEGAYRGGAQSLKGCASADKESTTLSVVPIGTQVGNQGLPNINGQGKALVAIRLAPDHELATVPVDVVEAEASNLSGA